MSGHPATVAIGFVRDALSGVLRRHMDPNQFLSRAQIGHELLGLPFTRVTAQQYETLILALMDELNDEAMGHLAKPLPRGAFAFLCRSALPGTLSLQVALGRWIKGHQLITNEIELMLYREDNTAWLRLLTGDTPIEPMSFLPVVYFKSLHVLASWFVGERIPLTEVEFACPRPPHADEYGRLFPGEVRFDSQGYGMRFPARYLDMPIVQDADSLDQFLRAAPGNLLLQYRNTQRLSDEIRTLLSDALPDQLPLSEVARALRISQRTLHRRLIQEGTRFKAIKDGLRRDIAIDRLGHSSLSVEAIASEIGFSDASTFYRAFRAWTGVPPGVYRQHSQGKSAIRGATL